MPIYTDKKTKRLYIQFDFLGQTHKKRLPKKTTKGAPVDLKLNLKTNCSLKLVVEIPMNNTVTALIQARRHNGSDLFFPSPKNGLQGTSVKKAMPGACARARIEPITIRNETL